MTDYARAVQYYFDVTYSTTNVCYGRADTYGDLLATWCDEHAIPSQEDLDDAWETLEGLDTISSEEDLNQRAAVNNFSPQHMDLYDAFTAACEAAFTAADAIVDTAAKDGIQFCIGQIQIIAQALLAIDYFVDVGDEFDS